MLTAYANLFVRFLMRSWNDLNQRHLGGSLKPPVFHISEGDQRLGSWSAMERTLSISANMLLKHASHEVLDVLRHEMAHQYADEVLGAASAGETAHGHGFRHACRLLEIHHHAKMRPVSEPSPILARIRKLLALAESHNEHEASLAMARARELMDRYELSLGDEASDFCYQYLGKPRKQRPAVEQFIATTLVKYFHIRVVWIPSKMVLDDKTVWLLEMCGTKTHLEVADYVYTYLRRELDWLWRRHQARFQGLKGKTVKREYQLGVLRGFMNKLAEVEADPAQGRELVLLREAQLQNFFRERHPGLRSGGRMSWRETETFKAGFAQGRELEIRKGVKRGERTDQLEGHRLLN